MLVSRLEMDDQNSEFTEVSTSSLSQFTLDMVFSRSRLPGRLRRDLSTEGKGLIYGSQREESHIFACVN